MVECFSFIRQFHLGIKQVDFLKSNAKQTHTFLRKYIPICNYKQISLNFYQRSDRYLYILNPKRKYLSLFNVIIIDYFHIETTRNQ